MVTDERILWVGMLSHTGAALAGVLVGRARVGGILDLETVTEFTPLVSLFPLAFLAGVGFFGFFIGLVSGGWAWILVGGVAWLQRLWTGLSTAAFLIIIEETAYHAVAAASGC
jgi:hypothetical protein